MVNNNFVEQIYFQTFLYGKLINIKVYIYIYIYIYITYMIIQSVHNKQQKKIKKQEIL